MKRLISIVLLACLLCGLFAGCKAKKQANTATDVEVILWEAGWGRDWLDRIVKNFNDSQDKYHATVVASAENRASEVIHGDATGDLYIASFNAFNAYKEYLYPLDDLLATKVDGEDGLTIGQKYGAFAENNKNPDGHTYALSSTIGNYNNLFYNADLMVDANGNPYKLPNTTDELVKLCLSLFSDGKVPFIHYPEYWGYMFEAWTAQYEGLDAYYNIWKGIYTDENGVEHKNDVRFITESKGRLEAYKVLEDLLSPKGYTYTNTNSFTHTTSQTYFLAGNAVMIPNGIWMEKEMGAASAGANILPMRTPVVSALADKLGIRSDKHLSLIVDYVDGTELSEADMAIVNGYSEEVIEAVREARSIYYRGNTEHMYIPSYSNCVDGALELLKYMCSDEGMKITSEYTHAPSGLKYSGDVEVDTSSWSAFMQESYKFAQNANSIVHFLNEPIFYMAGIDKLYINDPVKAMTYRTDGGTLTAEAYWAKEVAAWEAKWPQALIDAGLQ